jgi:hypothetical protein
MWQCGGAITRCGVLFVLGPVLQAVTAAGVTKDAEWVQGLMEAVITQLSDGDPQRCDGTNMDGAAVNRRAMRDLEVKHPHMVNFACQSHCLDLLIKDLSNNSKREEKQTCCGATLQTVVKLAGAVGESEKLRALVNKAQMEKYKKVRCTAHLGLRHHGMCHNGTRQARHSTP